METSTRFRVARWVSVSVTAAALVAGTGAAGASQLLAPAGAVRSAPTAQIAVFSPTEKLAAPGGGSGGTAALPSGSCSGIQGCNDFIAECVGAGGDFVPGGTRSPQGEPTSGSCGPAKPLPPE